MPRLLFERMEHRLRVDFDNSDAEGFEALMLFGELMLKLTVSGLIACLKPDKDNTRYSLSHRLVRANSIGDWNAGLTELLTGTARQFLIDEAREYANTLTRKTVAGTWEDTFSTNVHEALVKAIGTREGVGTGVRAGWSHFVTLRNRTRAHGAITGGLKSDLAPHLNQAMMAYAQGFSLFHAHWAYVKRNLSGKYRVTSLMRDQLTADYKTLKKNNDVEIDDGVYVDVGGLKHVDLAHSDPDFVDFYLPNGRFTNRAYELLSYITGRRESGEASRYADPPGSRPKSETSGSKQLDSDVAGSALHNLPPRPSAYIARTELEASLKEALTSQYPIISLTGRGGIGKTSLALTVLHSDAICQHFEVIVWFSARDIDLMLHGPRKVEPDVLNTADVSRQFVQLLKPYAGEVEDPTSFLESSLSDSPTGGPYLYVFDNFETVSNPRDMFLWLANAILPPNKVLITSRERTFDRDYRIPVEGMAAAESELLIQRVARERGIEGHLTPEFVQHLHNISGGHPYIMKVLLGAAERTGDFGSMRSELAPRDDLLAALFERSFSALTPLARRVFLTLCSWNSPQNELCVSAVLARSTGEADIPDAIDDLEQVSFIETRPSEVDGTRFLVVPLAGYLFGQAKLNASPDKIAVHADREVLLMFGAVQEADISRGALDRAEHYLKIASRRAENGGQRLRDSVQVVEYIARRSPRVWVLLSLAFEESQVERDLDSAVRYMRRYLESGPTGAEARSAWERVAHLARVQENPLGELHAIAEYCAVTGTWKEKVSDGIHRVAQILADHKDAIEKPDRAILVRKLISAFESHLAVASASELSRVAWLHLHLDEPAQAKRLVRRGLDIEPENFHCRNLAANRGLL